MQGIKVTQQDIALQIQGGRICGTLRNDNIGTKYSGQREYNSVRLHMTVRAFILEPPLITNILWTPSCTQIILKLLIY